MELCAGERFVNENSRNNERDVGPREFFIFISRTEFKDRLQRLFFQSEKERYDSNFTFEIQIFED